MTSVPPDFDDVHQLGKYVDLHPIGQGAMGRVYRARDSVLDRTVAVKTVLPGSNIFREEAMVRRFQREARIAAGLNHPGIVTVYDFGDEGGLFYLVMEHLEGEDLGAALRRGALGELSAKLDVMEAICEAVDYAHQQGMVHRDLKPSNIFWTKDGRIKILDFGLARWAEAPKTTMGLAGTPQYMSPEQVKGESVDARSDVFSLGSMFYELLTDQRCFPAPTIHAILFQVLQRQPESVRGRNPHLPDLADLVLAKALTKEPDLRFANAGELLDALRWLRRVIEGEVDEETAIRSIGLEDVRVAEAETGPGHFVPPPLPPLPVAGLGSEVPTAVSHASAGPKSEDLARVRFLKEEGGDRTIESRVADQATLLDLALEAGVPCFHECGGRARCSTCRVRVVDGTGLMPRTQKEARLASRLGWGDEIRLSCQATVIGDVQVQRLIHDADDFGLLRGERNGEAPRETTLAAICVRVRNRRAILERSAPYDIIHLLNRFYYEVGEPIVAAGGTISECRDAAVIGLFGLEEGSASDKCLAAVRAGLRIVRRVDELAKYLQRFFGFDPEVGVGIHFARTIVGRVGHASAQSVTALGELAPTAGWLAGVEPPRPPCLLVTEEVVNLLEDQLRLGETVADSGARGSDRDAWVVHDLKEPDAALMVQSSFDVLLPRKREAAALFYRLLFQTDPWVEPLFGGVDMSLQGGKLMDLLATAVQGLDRFDELRPAIRELGLRHAEYGVELRHYDAVEQALLETLSQMLGSSFTPELRQQWALTLGAVSAEMIAAGGYVEAKRG